MNTEDSGRTRVGDEWISSSRCALLIVDIQNDYCHPAGVLSAIEGGSAVVAKMCEGIARLRAAAEAVDVPEVVIQSRHSPASDTQVWLSRSTVSSSTCREGSFGAQPFGLTPKEGSIVVRKSRYSAFIGTDLEDRLRALGRDTLVVCGTQTNICVESTVRDGFQRDFYTVLVSDATCAATTKEHESALVNVDGRFGAVRETDEVLRRWQTSGARR